jgi:peptidoglycan/LPS O-acetylase OafA/YrhL
MGMNIISTTINIFEILAHFTDNQRVISSPLTRLFLRSYGIYIISYAIISFFLSQIIRSFTLSGERGTGFSFMQTYRE